MKLYKRTASSPTTGKRELPNNASPYTSTVVFITRMGNPKGIKDWPDLVKDDVKVDYPHPKTSGGGRWNFAAAWGFITIHKKGAEPEAEEFVRKLYKNVPKLDTGARGSTLTFAKGQLGDVMIAWENEALLLQKEYPDKKFEVVYPSVSILAEPPVAVVDKVVDKRGTRAAAEEYMRFLYSEHGASNHWKKRLSTEQSSQSEEIRARLAEPGDVHDPRRRRIMAGSPSEVLRRRRHLIEYTKGSG